MISQLECFFSDCNLICIMSFLFRLVMGSTKMDTYVEPEIEEVPGPMDEDDIMMDDHIGCDHEEVSLTGKSSEHLISNPIFDIKYISQS